MSTCNTYLEIFFFYYLSQIWFNFSLVIKKKEMGKKGTLDPRHCINAHETPDPLDIRRHAHPSTLRDS